MHIGLVGATGFVGGHILSACEDAGYTLTALVHPKKYDQMKERHPQVQWIAAEFSAAPDEAFAHCTHFINAVGIIRATRRGSFEQVHVQWPQAIISRLAPQCAVIQVSALGADAESAIAYQRTKGQMEAWLREQRPQHCIFQPSFLVGPRSPAVQVFARLASLPLCPLPGGGRFPLQAMAIDDLVAAIMAAIKNDIQGTYPCGGGEAVTLREMLALMRRARGTFAAIPLPIPSFAIALGAYFTDVTGFGPISGDEWAMLQQGSTCDNSAFTEAFSIAPAAFVDYWPEMIKT